MANENKQCFSYIRFSSEAQGKEGKTSLDRQLSIAPTVAARRGWVFNDQLSLKDLGLSGYKGKHLKEGCLGQLLVALKENKIPPNTVMICESFDRLSRLPPLETLKLIEEILLSGLELYVDRNSKLYTKASLKELPDLIIFLLEAHAANEYSAKLGQRVSKAWEIKKGNYRKDGKPFKVSKTPGWLTWNEERREYDVDPIKSDVVRRVFQLVLDGVGMRTICHTMMKENVPPISHNEKSGNWCVSNIRQWLTTKRVLGFYTDKKDGTEYKIYPPIIEEATYYRIQNILNSRKTGKHYGQVGNATNLFSGLLKCPKCGRGYVLHTSSNKNRTSKWTAIGCTGYYSGACNNGQISYPNFEQAFLAWTQHSSQHSASFRQSYRENTDEVRNELSERHSKSTYELNENKGKLQQMEADYNEAPSKALGKLMAQQEQVVERLEKELEEINEAMSSTTACDVSLVELHSDKFIEDWKKHKDDKEFRLKVRQLIRDTFREVIVHGNENKLEFFLHNVEKPVVVELMRSACVIDGDVVEYLYAKKERPVEDLPPKTRKARGKYNMTAYWKRKALGIVKPAAPRWFDKQKDELLTKGVLV